MNNAVEIPLGITGISIGEVRENEFGDILIRISVTAEGAVCPKCGKPVTKSYGHGREIWLRHLPAFGRRTFVIIRPKRYQCPYCGGGPTVTQKVPWYRERSQYTDIYEKHILRALINSTIHDVSIKEDIGYDAVRGIIDRNIGKQVKWNEIRYIGTIGIDEISLKKGHGDFVTVVTSLSEEGTKILSVLSGRKKRTVGKFFKSIPKRLKKTVRSVCCDMYDGYISAAKEVFGKNVIITVDRFHVAKMYGKCLDNVRKREMVRLKKELPEKEYEKMKGVMHALRKKDADLTPEEREILKTVFGYSEILKTVYEFCDDLTYIFDRKISKEKALREIESWKEMTEIYDLNCFEKFIKTLNKYEEEIANYFIRRQTSGFVEGLNNKIKVIKRRCYGILNVTSLFQRIHIDLEGYYSFAG
ncbi:ISL3 family transposase [Desulfonema ishimotonii]|uniref:ISL3 family transposase n=1 Tax=Desulfonema ishimotonii TaxID=45657 RepID=A0A401FX23_9BACT|nr:ISL3 family transposase [Desulfonema ishimotonii]GBC61520.1 ISL3 family transposase [Desulfonema ishimotonii]GBC61993.1 ISL3 family transposase [Desulfonema ishimotonii]